MGIGKPRPSGKELKPYVRRDSEQGQEEAKKALQLRRTGATYREIAVALGYKENCEGNIYRIVKHALTLCCKDEAKAVFEMECQRLDALQKAVWTDAMAGDLNACAMVLRICESRRRLLAIDQPATINHQVEVSRAGETRVDWKALQRDPAAMKLAEEFALVAERFAKMPEQPVIEAQSEEVDKQEEP
ncbi:MAG: hypothetical protein WC551_10225 [Patescibacteria group bacterium]